MSGLVPTLGFFLLISLLVSLVCAASRDHDWRHILRETVHFFTLMTVGILVFSAVVHLLEWAFIRRL